MPEDPIKDEAHELTLLIPNSTLEEKLKPQSQRRNLTLENAVYNLIGTIVGGGLLSLPDAFSHAGILPSTLMMIFSAGISIFSMRLFCACAESCGADTYSHVIRFAFGNHVEFVASILYTLFLCLVLVGYMMLIKEIWTPLFYFIIPSLRRWTENSRQRENIASDYFLLLFLVSLFPLLLKDDLLSLRHANYASFIALIVLVVSMADKVFRTSYETIDIHKINWYSTDISDWVYAFPIVGISFYCMSNLLPVYERLIDPTQERVDFVLNASVGGCAILFYSVALSGYLYAKDETRDNILLNFDIHLDLVTLGRLGFGLMLVLVLPLNMLPCKQALLSLPILFKNLSKVDDSSVCVQLEVEDQQKVLVETLPYLGNVIFTLAILIFCYILSVYVPGVGILWAFCGSSMSLIFGFFIPCVCFLKLCDDRTHNRMRSYLATFVAIFSFMASIVCTIQIFYNVQGHG